MQRITDSSPLFGGLFLFLSSYGSVKAEYIKILKALRCALKAAGYTEIEEAIGFV